MRLSRLGPDEQTPPTEERDRYHARVLEKLRHKVGVRDTQGSRGCGNAGDSRNGTTIASLLVLLFAHFRPINQIINFSSSSASAPYRCDRSEGD